ncbi:MAG: radical SAM protein [Proteobacteria bacterium]|nr:radical SAM protein [Pseudomonadota bacterium]
MTHTLLIQLPIPKLNFGKKTGNIPLGAACLKQAATGISQTDIDIVPESLASYMGDAALLDMIVEKKPDILGFSVFNWNVERSLYLAEQVKKKLTCRIVLGGPEVTPDNDLIVSSYVDDYVYGEGEQAFIDLLSGMESPKGKCRAACAESIFKISASPYLDNLLDPFIENLMLLETQRGCPYSCGYCFYNKSRGSLSFKDESLLLDGIQWAVDQGIDELYLLDPSLNARPNLKQTLKHISRINSDKRLAINSEIRAEWIDDELANLFEQAGFTGFEIGLQSTNKHALKIMKRPTDLKKFIQGANRLKDRDILPRIDLISGLPGDDLDGFSQSIGFVAEQGLDDDVQVFPLSVLPGTSFRKHSKELGLRFESSPPYTVLETDQFSRDDLMLSFDYAESLFDIALFPLPELNVAWKKTRPLATPDVWVRLGQENFLTKLVLDTHRPLQDIETLARRLTFPYQVFVNSNLKDEEYIFKCLNILSINNPFSPIEIIFIEPNTIPDTRTYLNHIHLKRPHYLDNDLRYLYGPPGNRAVQFTVISKADKPLFSGDMKRHVYHWTEKRLPDARDLDELGDFEGILIDGQAEDREIMEWQIHFAPSLNYIPQLSFSRIDQQLCWLSHSLGDEYCFSSLTLY